MSKFLQTFWPLDKLGANGSRAGFLLWTVVFLFLASCSVADRDNPLDPEYQGPRGHVGGRVELLSGAAVTVADGRITVDYGGAFIRVSEMPELVTTSSADGGFVLTDVPTGSWSLSITAPGYVSAAVNAVVVLADRRTQVEAPVRLQEDIEGDLLFGSRRSGFPGVFRADAGGTRIESLTPLPFVMDACRYMQVGERGLLAVRSSYFAYKDEDGYREASGVAVFQYPELKPVTLIESGDKLDRPALMPDGDLIVEVHEGEDVYLARIPPRSVLRAATLDSLEEFRIRLDGATPLGAPGPSQKEYSPTVSPDGRLAFLRSRELSGSGDTPLFEIVVDDRSAEGKAVFSVALSTLLEDLSDKGYFDIDGNGNDDLEKFGVLLQGYFRGWIPPMFAGVDWSQPLSLSGISTEAQLKALLLDYLEGEQPDGIDFNVLAFLLQMLDLATLRDLSWLPDGKSLVYVDRYDSLPRVQRELTMPITNALAPVTDAAASPLLNPKTGRPTAYYFDLNGNGVWEYGFDQPFWYDDRSSYVPALTLTQNPFEVQTLRRIAADAPGDERGSVLYQGSGDEFLFSPTVSPDGKRVAMAVGPVKQLFDTFNLFPIMTKGDILTVDPRNSYVTRITQDGLDNKPPCWVPR